MPNSIVAVQYTADSGNQFVTGMDSEVFAQVNGSSARLVGGSAALPNEALDPLPRQMKPRRVVAVNAAGIVREIICLSAAAPLYAKNATIDLEDSDGASTEFTVQKLKSEDYRRRQKQPA